MFLKYYQAHCNKRIFQFSCKIKEVLAWKRHLLSIFIMQQNRRKKEPLTLQNVKDSLS